MRAIDFVIEDVNVARVALVERLVVRPVLTAAKATVAALETLPVCIER